MKKMISYGKKEIEHISKGDKLLGEFIHKTDYVKRYSFDDFFHGLCYNIINQQLSMKAADSLYAKIENKVGTITPEKMCNSELLYECGLSRTKANCISLCAEKIIGGELSENRLSEMSDEKVIKTLTEIRGIGAWTAEMTLIFCLGRKDVLSLSDFGIRKGLSILHGIDIKDITVMRKYKELYSPFGTVASIYLWEIKENNI